MVATAKQHVLVRIERANCTAVTMVGVEGTVKEVGSVEVKSFDA